MKPVLLAAFALMLALPSAHAETAPYAGQDARTIKALSSERAERLLAGAGLGYALAAELNGWPGPLHALELADDLSLTPAQRAETEAIRAQMLAEARPLGETLIAAEAALDALFAGGTPDAAAVAAATMEIARIEGQLRAVHLSAHVALKPILTRHQRMIYARTRGYATGKQDHDHSHGGGQH